MFMAGSLVFVAVVHLYGRESMFFKMPETFLIEHWDLALEQLILSWLLPGESVLAWTHG
jgi:hypothetical protein